jgi:hypothetical protein
MVTMNLLCYVTNRTIRGHVFAQTPWRQQTTKAVAELALQQGPLAFCYLSFEVRHEFVKMCNKR